LAVLRVVLMELIRSDRFSKSLDRTSAPDILHCLTCAADGTEDGDPVGWPGFPD
jgi:hypothetical protein